MNIIKALTISDCISKASQIASKYNVLDGKKCYVFCVDKIALSFELEIAKICGGGFFNIDVSTFTRYITIRSGNVKALSKEASVMAIRKIILEKQNSLVCFKNLKYCPNLSVTVYELISQLASAKVTPEDLYAVLDNQNTLGGALNLKLKDVTLIYSEYRKYLQTNGYIDRNDYLDLMPSIIYNDESLKGATVILAGFSSVTRQRAEIFEALNNVAGEVYAVTLAGDNSEVYTNETLERLLKIDSFARVEQFVSNHLTEVDILSKYLFNPEVFKPTFKKYPTNAITVTEYQDVYSEIKGVAKDIVKEVKLGGNRYKNVAVMVGGLDDYRLIINKVFSEYGIPYYLDKAENLSKHPICAFILNLLDVTRKNLAVKDVIKLVSNGMFTAEKEKADKFINYIKKYAITRSSIKNEFKYQTENLVDLEEIRNKVITVYNKLNGAKTVSSLIDGIKFAIEFLSVDKNIELYNQKLINYGETVYAEFNDKILDKVYALLDEIKFVLGDGKISLIDFKTVFLSGATSTSIGAIPLFNDAVYVGECKDVKIKNADILYAVGISGNIPFAKSDSALLTDGDLASLDEFKIIVEPKIKIVNKREKENISVAFMSFNKKLKVSLSNANASGKGTVKSEIITYLTKIFDINVISARKKETEVDSILLKGYKYDNDAINEFISDKYLSKASTYLEVAKLKQNLDKRKSSVELASVNDAVSSLDGEIKTKVDGILNIVTEKPSIIKNANACLSGEEISATTLEEYFACPYSNFIRNSLRLKTTETGEMQQNEIGTLLHALLETYVNRISEVTSIETSNALVDNIISELYAKEEYAKYVEKPMYRYVFNKLQSEGKKACYNAYETLVGSEFKPKYLELKFGENKAVKGIKLNAKSGEYKVKGTIDRVDTAGNKVRIIDYKSGKTHPDVTSFFVGKNLQLYLYMNVFKGEEYEPSGAYYFPIKNDYEEEGKKTKRIMQGNTLDSEEVIKLTDKNLTNGSSSSLVSVSLKQDGTLTGNSSVLTKEEMSAYLDYAVMIASKGVDEINLGYVKPSPYDANTKCVYCEYGGLCKRMIKEGDNRKVKGVCATTVVNAVKYEKQAQSEILTKGEN
ncbi:MAG: exodeoxyribonuclease V subunit gamma [Clostridia bacterium]|nr:exodeoxyribonuclease V subunit gamma [Clostridia bacterium]